MSLFAGKETWLVESGERYFDRLAGHGGAHIPVALVEQHLRELAKGVSRIEHYVDRRIAHYDKRGLARPLPTFADLTEALKTLERIIIFYWRLLKGDSMTTMLPTILFDWEEVFTFPWISVPEADSGEAM